MMVQGNTTMIASFDLEAEGVEGSSNQQGLTPLSWQEEGFEKVVSPVRKEVVRGERGDWWSASEEGEEVSY